MPEDAPGSKVAATEGYGAEVLRFDRYTQDREEITAETAARLGLHVVHAYDDPFVIAGQGTVALELIEDAGPLDVLVVCLGGGGLLAGCTVATRALAPGAGSSAWSRWSGRRAARPSRRATRSTVPVTPTIADGQQTAQIGRRNCAIISAGVDEIVGVTDDGDRRRHAAAVRAAEGRRRAERRVRAGGHPGRARRRGRSAGRRHALGRQRRRRAVRRADGRLEPARPSP